MRNIELTAVSLRPLSYLDLHQEGTPIGMSRLKDLDGADEPGLVAVLQCPLFLLACHSKNMIEMVE